MNLCTIRKLSFRDELVKSEVLATTILPPTPAVPLDEVCEDSELPHHRHSQSLVDIDL